jgi:hypothetical protein
MDYVAQVVSLEILQFPGLECQVSLNSGQRQSDCGSCGDCITLLATWSGLDVQPGLWMAYKHAEKALHFGLPLFLVVFEPLLSRYSQFSGIQLCRSNLLADRPKHSMRYPGTEDVSYRQIFSAAIFFALVLGIAPLCLLFAWSS